MKLNAYEIIQIIGIISTSITSIVAIIISVVSLRQNSKVIEETNRPYISVYANCAKVYDPVLYLIIKNFGETSGTITAFSTDKDLSKCTINGEHIPFDNIVGTTLNPKEQIIYPIEPFLDSLNISITYKSTVKTYFENIHLNLNSQYDSIHPRVKGAGNELEIISYTLQDIAEKLL